jgi:hypothetical protein
VLGSIDHLGQQGASAVGPVVRYDCVDGLDPLFRLGRVDVRPGPVRRLGLDAICHVLILPAAVFHVV